MRIAYPQKSVRFKPCVSFGCEGLRPFQPREIPAPSDAEIERFVENIRRLQEQRNMAKMRAKLTIQSVTLCHGCERLKFSAQYSTTKEDNSFSEATPDASMEMTVTNKALHGQFKPGQAFYVDFTPVE